MATEVISELRDNSNQQLVNAGDSVNNAIRVNAVSGTFTALVGTATVVQSTASSLNATVVGTLAATQSGAWTTTVTQPTGTNLHAVVDSGTITNVPSGTQSVAQTGSPWGVAGTITAVSGTASNLQATVTGTVAVTGTETVVGTVTVIPSGTQNVAIGTVTSPAQVWGAGTAGTWTNVGYGTTAGTANLNLPVQVQAGTVTIVPSGTQAVNVASGTVAVTQVTSPWLTHGTATIIATNVGTGADFGIAISAPHGVEIHGINATLVTSTQTANRSPAFAINDGTSVNYFKVRATTTQTATSTIIYQLAEGVPRETEVGGPEVLIPLPVGNFYPSGVNINSSTANMQTLDQWSAIRIIAEIW